VSTNGNGNGNGHSDAIGDAEFFLVPLLATDPLPYLFDGDGNPVNAEGRPVESNGNGNGLPEAIKRLQKEARPRRSSKDG
jgi:hypothetical protein